MVQHPFKTYSLELLHYSLHSAGSNQQPGDFAEADTAKTLRRMEALLEKSGKRELLLLGYGSGELAAAMADAVARSNGPFSGVRATVLSLDPASVQANLPAWWTDDGPCQVLADSSSWALVLLLAAHGPAAADCAMLLNPELPKGKERTALTALQRTLLSAVPAPLMPTPVPTPPRLSVAAILSPDEPGLDEFFAQIPDWAHEVCVVWDADEPIHHPALGALPESVTLRTSAHPLELDFAAQRNRMLELCSGEWVVYLDADETLSPQLWDALPAVMAGDGLPQGMRNPDFWFLPRRNLDHSGEGFHMGWGLWPDLQLRLFRRRSTLAFRNPVHEELTGVGGPGGILVNGPIDHHGRVRKSAEELEKKLDLFSRASGAANGETPRGSVVHRLNPAHPSLPLASLPVLAPGAPLLRLLLPVNPAKG